MKGDYLNEDLSREVKLLFPPPQRRSLREARTRQQGAPQCSAGGAGGARRRRAVQPSGSGPRSRVSPRRSRLAS